MNFELLFDEKYYLNNNPDVAAFINAGDFNSGLEHFKEVGQFEGRNPSGLFDTNAYLTLNLDVAAAVQRGELTAYGHFINSGQFERRDPSALFDTRYYLEQNPDVAAVVERNEITAIDHFVNVGRSEGRDPSATFDETFAPKFPPPLPSIDANSEYNVMVVASGLDNPRDLAFGSDGDLYVVEAGRGGDGPSIPAPEIGVELSYGPTGAVTRVRDGVQERVITGLPSLARSGSGIGAYGPHAIGFNQNGDAYLVTGFTSSPDIRAQLGSVGSDLGQLVKLNLADNSWERIADLVQYEGLNNPDGEDVVSNPYAVSVQEGNVFVVDAGANDLLRVDNAGNISLEAVFDSRLFGDIPIDFVPPVAVQIGPDGAVLQSVPTSIVTGPDGAYYVSELTGYPLPENGAQIYRVEPGKEPEVYADGFTQVIDLAFGLEGNLYVLEYATNSLALTSGGNPTGALVQVSPDGSRKTLVSDGLINPAGVAVGSDGAIYVSNYGSVAGEGQVLRFERVNDSSSPEQEKLVFGSQGNDILFAGSGNSILTGGQGTDQFWIANAAFPSSPNTITDFEVGIDILGIGGINGVDKFEGLNITYGNNGVTISAVGQEIAMLQV